MELMDDVNMNWIKYEVIKMAKPELPDFSCLESYGHWIFV